MTNLELEREVKKLQKQSDEVIQVIQRMGQKNVSYDQIVTQLKEQVERLGVDISSLKKQLQQLQISTKSEVIRY